MEVVIEELGSGALVNARIVLTGNRTARVIASLSMSRADWEDFIRCLGYPRQAKRGGIVFTPAAKEPRPDANCRLLKAPRSFPVHSDRMAAAVGMS
jgi:hypothetical protein